MGFPIIEDARLRRAQIARMIAAKEEIDRIWLKESAHQQKQVALQLLQYGKKLKPSMPAAKGKCPSCGSREFRQHAGRSVCSYCRSES